LKMVRRPATRAGLGGAKAADFVVVFPDAAPPEGEGRRRRLRFVDDAPPPRIDAPGASFPTAVPFPDPFPSRGPGARPRTPRMRAR
jgi:hypothetical protein